MRPYMALARWLGRMALRAEWKASGRNPQYADAGDIADYFFNHRAELLKEAWDHPVAKEYRRKERMKLAKKAVVAEIKHKGRRVRSIDPIELNRLIDAYLKDHPWEGATPLVEKVCL
jgi:hypothetical protein